MYVHIKGITLVTEKEVFNLNDSPFSKNKIKKVLDEQRKQKVNGIDLTA